MEPTTILFPSFVLFIWTILILLKSFTVRVAALKSKNIRMSYFRHYMGEAPEVIQVHSRNYINLLELPVFFYVITIFIFMLGKVDPLYIKLSWAFVGSRIIHSLIHITYNNVNHRLLVFTLGLITLTWMWVRFFISI